jgi:hypothetical protein
MDTLTAPSVNLDQYVLLTTIAKDMKDTSVTYNSLYKFLKSHHLIERVGHTLVVKKIFIDLIFSFKNFRDRKEKFNYLLFYIENRQIFESVIKEIVNKPY